MVLEVEIKALADVTNALYSSRLVELQDVAVSVNMCKSVLSTVCRLIIEHVNLINFRMSFRR